MNTQNAYPQTCHWKEDLEGNWHSECGESFYFADGSPHDNKFMFCPFCGGKLIEHKFQENKNHEN